MNALRILSLSSSARRARCRVLCASLLALLAANVPADEVAAQPFMKQSAAHIEAAHARSYQVAAAWSHAPALPASWMSAELVPAAWQRDDSIVLRRAADWLVDDRYIAAASGFDTSNLFRTRKEQKYRDTLRLLLTKRQLRVWLREDLHLQCEIKRYRSLAEGRELGLKLGLYYRFE
jgi:hypothetical protein